MSEKENRKGKRVKSITLRFNKEVAPFQHVRIEAMATITKEDDADEVRQEVEDFCCHSLGQLVQRVFNQPKLAENSQTQPGPF